MRIIGIAALAIASIHTAAVAQKPPVEDKMVCKRIGDADTGSHFARSKRVCMKASEWKMVEDETQRTLRSVGDRGTMNPDSVTRASGGPS